uniref:50S ribosomal protein L35 n=1 Tax=Acrochaetium secundatum TaxID=209631 RepID=A0A4D6BKA6_9FLOR|nr:ribosomal protein L35 [Acrochaetium secundatum]QBX88442.1 ribosomal protein L35 [Acrochaetium secundatum]
MPKLKTSSSISKRFKVTAKSKLLRHKASHSHLLEKKSPKRKHNLSQVVTLKSCDFKRLKSKLKAE